MLNRIIEAIDLSNLLSLDISGNPGLQPGMIDKV